MTQKIHFMNRLDKNRFSDRQGPDLAGAMSRREALGLGAAAAAGLAAAGIPAAAAARPVRGKVTLVTGSPRRRGTSFLLADEFMRGLEERKIDAFRFDAAFKRVTACSGCDRCGLGSSPCVYRDDMFELNPHFLESELIVLCTPLYYFGFSAQLKLVIDRFYAINNQFHHGRRAVLLATAWNSNDWTFNALVAHYKTLCRYMDWEDAGMVLGYGCGTRWDCEQSIYPDQAYQLAKSIQF